jgi:hypothetical protein
MEVQDGWEPLCQFLGVPVPNEPFPRTNEAEAVQQRFKECVLNALIIWLAIISFTCMGMYVLYSLYVVRAEESDGHCEAWVNGCSTLS